MEIIGPIQTSREDPTQHTLLFGETKRRPPMANIGGSILGGGAAQHVLVFAYGRRIKSTTAP